MHARQLGRRVPAEVSIEVTHRCPLDCHHCYNNLPMGDVNARKQELTFEEHVRLLDELVQMGTLWILYTGGEIFARKDFLDIYTEAKKRGFLITLFTNGTLITPRIADYLVEYRPFAIEITLYGATRETYEALTQLPGSFDRCMRGIRLLKERGLPLALKTVPTSINYHEVYEMKLLAEELGVEFKFDSAINPRTDCSQSPLAVRLTPEQAVALDAQDPVRMAEYRDLMAEELAEPFPRGLAAQKYVCGGGDKTCAVDPNGQLTICLISHQDGYNIRQGSFSEGWSGKLHQIRNTKRHRETICTRCRIRSLCNICPATAELETGDPESPVSFLCQVAHLRAYALGLDVPEHGDCSCCPGGADHTSLQDAAKRLKETALQPGVVVPFRPANTLLPVLQSRRGCSEGGCSACGH